MILHKNTSDMKRLLSELNMIQMLCYLLFMYCETMTWSLTHMEVNSVSQAN